MSTNKRKITRPGKRKARSTSNPAGFKYMKKPQGGRLGALPRYLNGDETDPVKKPTRGMPSSLTNLVNDKFKKYSEFPTFDFMGTSFDIADEIKYTPKSSKSATTPDFAADEAELDAAQFEADTLADVEFANSLELDPTDKAGLDKFDAEIANSSSNIFKEVDEDLEEGAIKNKKQKQFFNPYGGVDVMGAANIFGQELGKPKGEKDALSMVSSGMKMVTGLGRSMASGAGYAKRNAFALDEYNKEQREGMTSGQEYKEDGGDIRKKSRRGTQRAEVDEPNYRHEGGNTGMSKEEFYKTQLEEPETSNWYDGVVDFFGMGDDAPNYRYEGGNTGMSKEEFYKKQLEEEGPYRHEGGNTGMSRAEFMDTNYEDGGTTVGTPGPDSMMLDENEEFVPELLTGEYSTGTENGPANAEVEKGEYIKTKDGNVTKVLGDTHENDGERMNLEQGTQIISNNLKLNKAQVKALNDEYGIKGSVKDTYAKTMDKFYKVSGLQDLIDEEAEVIKSIKKQTVASKEAGADVSTSSINLEFLSSRIKDISDEKKELQTQATSFFDKVFKLQESTKPKEKVQTEFKIGGTVYSKADILGLAKKHSLDEDRAFEILKKFGNGGGDTDAKETDEERERLKVWLEKARRNGFKEDINLEAEDLGPEAGKVQKWMAENYPEDVVEYFKTNPITSKGIATLQKTKKGQEVIKALGFDPKKSPGMYTKQERVDIQNASRQAGIVSREFILDQFQDNLWSFRNPIGKNWKSNVTTTDTPLVGISNLEQDLTLTPPTGTPYTKPLKNRKVKDAKDSDGKEVYLLPDQSPLPPTGLQPHLKAKRRYGRMDAKLLTADAGLAEIERSKAAAMESISRLPSGQREAAIVQLNANVEGQKNKLKASVDMGNQSILQKTEAFNTRQGDREEEAKWADILNYEQRSLGALANTEDDFRRYFSEGTKRNMENFNAINNVNLTNAMNENFNISNSGIEFTGTEGLVEGWESDVESAQGLPNASKKKTTKRGRKA